MSTQSADVNPWVVAPETVDLDLEWDGRPFSITIKKRLNTAEDRRVRGAAVHGMRGFARPGQAAEDFDPEMLLNMQEAGYVRLEVFIVAWSLKTENGELLPIPSKDRAQAGALDSRLTDIMETAITKHVEERDAKDAPLKKVGSSVTRSRAISA